MAKENLFNFDIAEMQPIFCFLQNIVQIERNGKRKLV
jgi:hypothetical protein